MATGLSVDALDTLVVLPWPAFMIRIPTGLLSVESPIESGEYPVTLIGMMQYLDALHLWVASERNELNLWNQSANFSGLYHHEPPSEESRVLLERTLPPGEWAPVVDGQRLRTVHLILNLLAGVCLELSDPRTLADSSQGSSGGGFKNVDGKRTALPSYDRFELRRAVQVDVRDAVRAYVEHGGRHPKVQTLVRGHWKMQAHGKGRELRKLVHVEPYWRGPEDAPVSARVKL